MSAATEQQNNGDVAVEKVAADAVKDDLKSQKVAAEDTKSAPADNGKASKDEILEGDTTRAKDHAKAPKRSAEFKILESKKTKKDADSDEEEEEEEEIIEEDSDIESDDYDIPYEGGDDEIECEDDDENDDGSGSDDQA